MAEFVVKYNYFEFNENFYQQISGAVVGFSVLRLFPSSWNINNAISSARPKCLNLNQD